MGGGRFDEADHTEAQGLNNPAPLPLAEFTAQLAEWIWALLSNTLESSGIHLDPQEPITVPSQET